MNKLQILEEFNRRGYFLFLFKKADGSIRHAMGTVDPGFINKYWSSTGNGYEELEEIIRYFDVDAQGWRCFYVERFLGFEEA